MGVEKKYTCDICTEILENAKKSYGVCFGDSKNFTLGGYGSTDEKHICFRCALRLRQQLNSEPITKELYKLEGVPVNNKYKSCPFCGGKA